jgi:hypothetical protein
VGHRRDLAVCVCSAHVVQASSVDQFDRLMFVTLCPLGIVAVAAVVHVSAPLLLALNWWGLAKARSRATAPLLPGTPEGRPPPAGPPPDAAVGALRSKAVRTALVLMFLVYPGVSTEIVKSFRCVTAGSFVLLFARGRACGRGWGCREGRGLHVCQRVPPASAAPFCCRACLCRCYSFDDGQSFLNVDLRINCDSSRYRAMLAYALAMLVLIPFGFPAALFWVLWRHRRQLYPRNHNRSLRVRHSPDAASPCVVACVEADVSATDRAALHAKMQRLGATLLALTTARARYSPGVQRTPAVAAASSPILLSTDAEGHAGCEPAPSGGADCDGASAKQWGPLPGPGHPTLQRDGEAMFHYVLPSSHAPTAAATVDAVVLAWHLAPNRYSSAADVEARNADPTVQHLRFAFQVGAWGVAWREKTQGRTEWSSEGKAYSHFSACAAIVLSPGVRQGFEPRCWYFEVVLLLVKLLLTAITVVFLPGSVAQVRWLAAVLTFFPLVGRIFLGSDLGPWEGVA